MVFGSKFPLWLPYKNIQLLKFFSFSWAPRGLSGFRSFFLPAQNQPPARTPARTLQQSFSTPAGALLKIHGGAGRDSQACPSGEQYRSLSCKPALGLMV